MIRRSTLLFLTCLGASSASAMHMQQAQAQTTSSPSVLIAQETESSAANVLSIGSRGRAVRALQSRLQAVDYYDDPVDGIYGLATQRAVLAFQEDQGLEPTGRLDDDTWAALETAESTAADASQPLLSQDAEGSDTAASPGNAVDAPAAPADELPPIGEAAPAAERESGGIGNVVGLGIGLAAIAASFGVGFFIANRSKLQAQSEAGDDNWSEAESQPGLTGGAPILSGNGAHSTGAQNGFSGNAALARVAAPLQATTTGQIGGTMPMGTTDVVDGLIKDLHNPDPSQRRKVIWELGQRGNSIAVQPLVDAMVSADSKEKSLVLAALSEIGIRSLKPMNRALAIALKDDNPEVRKNAIRDLTRIYELVVQISQMLGHATEDEDPEVRQTATWALDQLNRIRRNQDVDSNMRSFTSGSGPNRFAS